MQTETPAATDIVFNIPSHIAIPESGVCEMPVIFAVRDQFKNYYASPATISVSPQNRGVSVENGYLVVTPRANQGVYTISAVSDINNDVIGKTSVNITSDSVGDGSFENASVGQLWATSSPSELHLLPYYSGRSPKSGEKLGVLMMNGYVSALYSNSVRRYNEGYNYVFNAHIESLSPQHLTTVTILVTDLLSPSLDDSLVVGQFDLSSDKNDVNVVFTPSFSITGSLMIAFNTDTSVHSQIIIMDDISVSDANVYAVGAGISGIPLPGKTLTAEYSFVSNFETEDASSVKWFISTSKNGIYLPIPDANQKTLIIESDMMEKYVKVQITPTSLSGPVTGESIMSSSMKIGEENIMPSAPPPIDDSNTSTLPPDDGNIDNTKKDLLYTIDLSPFSGIPYLSAFADMENHWAKKDVAVMTEANITNGVGGGLFEPDQYITRAEFCAMLIRAFELAPLYYEDQYQDVKGWHWYSGVVQTATKYGFSNGTGNGRFSPEHALTREQMIVMLIRALKKTHVKLSEQASLTFSDSDEISSWAQNDVAVAFEEGIINGMPDGTFCPQKNATRAEAVAALKRMILFSQGHLL